MSDEATHWWGCDSVHPDCHHPAERILTDLIAELRSAHQPMADLDGEPRLCVQGCGVLPCHSLSAAASAEARLRTLQPPGGSAGADLTKGEGSDLRDLIAELRAHCREPSCGCDIGRAADHAEARLRRLVLR